MKLLVDPKWKTLIEQLPESNRSEILMCILDYPERDFDSSIWAYIKGQLDEYAARYTETCRRNEELKAKRAAMKAALAAQPISDVNKRKEKEYKTNVNIIEKKENEKKDISVKDCSQIVENFLISNLFSFDKIGILYPAFKLFIEQHPHCVIESAEKTIKEKFNNKKRSMSQILNWIEKQNSFFQTNIGK